MSEHDGVHNRDRWEESDDWFAEPEPTERQPSDLLEENWLKEDAAPAAPRRGLLLFHWRRVAVAGGAVLGAVLLLLWLTGAFGGAGPAPKPTPTTRRPTTTTIAGPVRAPVRLPTTTLTPGSRGPEVKRLQRALARLGYSRGRVDGSYGPATMNALKRFQQANRLQPDGVLGPKTLRTLKSKLRTS